MPGNATVVPSSVRSGPRLTRSFTLEPGEHPGDLGTGFVDSSLELSGRSGPTQLNRRREDALEPDDRLIQDVALRARPGRQSIAFGIHLRREGHLLDQFSNPFDVVTQTSAFGRLARHECELRSPLGCSGRITRCSRRRPSVQETGHCCDGDHRSRHIKGYICPHRSRAPTRIADTPTVRY